MDIKAAIGALRRRLSGETAEPPPPPLDLEQRAAQARAGAQAIANKLPAAVMPHAGLAEDKRRKAMIDKQMQEGAQ